MRRKGVLMDCNCQCSLVSATLFCKTDRLLLTMSFSTVRISCKSFVFFIVLLFFAPACQPLRSLGKNPSGEELIKIERLPNYRNGTFQNLESPAPDTVAMSRRRGGWTRLLRYLVAKKPANTRPPKPLPVFITDIMSNDYKAPTVIWFGHSSFLLKTAQANILFDPDFSDYAGPFKGMVTAFAGTDAYGVKDMPPIDALVISHDHYDHLDYRTVKQLKKKVKRVIVPMGVGSHFRKWGYKKETITELNWNDSVRVTEGVTITATPAHHRSNRTMAQNKTLWASYVIAADGYKIYFSGDSGYSSHFKLIGNSYGPFDLALLECGQYNQKWPRSHMFPYQTAKAATDLKASMIIPVHWGKFAESEHPWNEPMELLRASADSLKLPVSIPFIGQPYTIKQPFQQIIWWKF